MSTLEEKIQLLEQQISDERQKLSADRMDISFGEIMNLYEQSELIIRPEYQRLFRWTNTQKTLLIESILMGIPIPPIFVAEDENGVWELVDGLQRVSTIISFFGNLKPNLVQNYEVSDVVEDLVSNSNNWELEAGDIIKDLEGFNVETLPQKYKLNIKRAVCRVEILRGESNTSLKYELFKRLNSGGTKLTPQEIRNAVYRGINPDLNELITELSQNIDFKDLTSLSETKRFLDKFMDETTSTGNLDSEKYKEIFNSTIALLTEIGDNNIFRNERNLFVPAVFEGVMIGTSENLDYYVKHKDELREKIHQLQTDDEFKRLSGSASNSRSRIKKRLQRAQEIFSYGN